MLCNDIGNTKKSLKPGEHVQLFRMKTDRKKGLYSEKCQFEASGSCCALHGLGVLCSGWCYGSRYVAHMFTRNNRCAQ